MGIFQPLIELKLKFCLERTQGGESTRGQNDATRFQRLDFTEAYSCIETPKAKHACCTLSIVLSAAFLTKCDLLLVGVVLLIIQVYIEIVDILAVHLRLPTFRLFRSLHLRLQPHHPLNNIVPCFERGLRIVLGEVADVGEDTLEAAVPLGVELVLEVARTLLLSHALKVLDSCALEKQVEDCTAREHQRVWLQKLIFYLEISLGAILEDLIKLFAVT